MALTESFVRSKIRAIRSGPGSGVAAKATVGGRAYSVLKLGLEADRQLELYGRVDAVSASFQFIVSEIAFDPAKEKQLRHDDTTYNIVGYRYDAQKVNVTLDVGGRYGRG